MAVYKIKKDTKNNKKKLECINEDIKGLDTKKYCGKIDIEKDGVKYQKEIRNEWE